MQKICKINAMDNVFVALSPLKQGETVCVEGQNITLQADILKGHKVALQDILKGAQVVKYGAPIGTATQDILKGAHVHVHNVKTTLDEKKAYAYHKVPEQNTQKSVQNTRFFMGYARKNGQVGIRNDLLILPTVGCVNGIAKALQQKMQVESQKHGIKTLALCHPYGCSQLGQDEQNTVKVLSALAQNANYGGVLILGLGCENSGVDKYKALIPESMKAHIYFMVAQEEEDEIKKGTELLTDLLSAMKHQKREKCPLSSLIVGLKCGGSDGLSGITANPLIGLFSDEMVQNGGTTILTEVPEMFGAEQSLMNRCETEALYLDTVHMVENFKQYYMDYGVPCYENPSPGNKKGGITTLEDKSLGCTQKSGTTLVKGVLQYGDRATKKGLNLLSAPGNDLVATTALAASGANLVLFSTGRGTPFMGPVPTVKISSNREICKFKTTWIDFDANDMIEEDKKTQVQEDFIQYILSVASGEETKAEKNNYYDIAIFKTGVTL